MFNFTPKGASMSCISKPLSVIISLPTSNKSSKLLCSTNFLSDIDPSYVGETKTIAPLGIIPIRTYTVFLFLYAENVAAWETNDDGRSIPNSVASIISLVLGYCSLKDPGIYFLTICHGG